MGDLQLASIEVKEDYRKEWNINTNDFVCLTMDGILLRETLYRVGGLGGGKPDGKNYFMLLKYVEAIYDYNFLKKCYPQKNTKELELEKKHLESRWCIIDKNGIEKVVFESFKYPYLVSNSCIYFLDSNYYNIETGELYCNSHSKVETSEFLFLKNSFDKDVTKRGVMKINKADGTFELFKD